MKALSDFFLGRYETEPLEDRHLARALLLTSAALATGSLALFMVIHETAIRDAVLILGLASLSLVAAIKAGRAKQAGAAASVIVPAIFAVMPFANEYKGVYELYFAACLGCLALIVNGFIERWAWQSICVLALSIAAVLVDQAYRVAPAEGHGGEGILWSNASVGVCVVVLLLSAFLQGSSKRRGALYLAMAEEGSRQNRERLRRLETAVDSSREALGMGASVTASAERTGTMIAELRESAAEARAEVRALIEAVDRLGESYRDIGSASRVVLEKVEAQSAVVAKSSAAVEEMTSSVGSISEITAARLEAIRRLEASTARASLEMDRAAGAVGSMSDSAASIAEIADVIRSIASRTDLLAMNAAIEAAHAGGAGKGFSVVADEIRKLSEETGSNVGAIEDDIERTVGASRTAAEANRDVLGLFREVDEETEAVALAMSEIGRGLGEISSGSSEILGGVAESVKFASLVEASAMTMEARVSASARSLEELGSYAAAVSGRLATIAERLEGIQEEADSVSGAGRRNQEGLEALMTALREAGGPREPRSPPR